MKHSSIKTHILVLSSCLLLLTASCSNKAENVTLRNQQDTLSWAMGMSLAQTAQGGFYDFDNDIILKAFKSTLNGEKQPLDNDTYNAACDYITFLVTKKQRQMAEEQTRAAGQKQDELFAKLTKDNPNVKKAPEGYYYEVLREGHGPKAQVGKRIRFDFKGINMTNNQVIEQTYGQREPIIHTLNRPMFQGLLCGMQLMNAGSKFRFYFPHQLVTGANGIPPYTPVIYEVELHEIYND